LPDGSTYCRPIHNGAGADVFDANTTRLRDEFLSMPALCLTVEQAARLVHMSVPGANLLIARLEHDGFLIHTPNGRYRLAEPLLC
jgi:hypothetical protein